MAGEENVFRLEAGERVTETEVHAACDQLVAEGAEVTRRAVLQRVGRGSMTTISRYVTSWEERQRARVEARDVELSPDEQDAALMFARQMAQRLTERLRREAAEEVTGYKDAAEREARRSAELARDYDALNAEKEGVIAGLRTEIDRLQDELTQAQADVAVATAVASDLDNQLKTQVTLTTAAETRAREAEARVEDAVAAAAEARGRADAFAADLERARQTERGLRDELAAAIAAGKQTEKDLRAELTTATGALATAQAAAAEQTAQLEAARAAVARLEDLVKATDRRAEHEAADRQAAEQRAAAAEAAQARLEGEIQELRARVMTLEAAAAKPASTSPDRHA
ncbi:DNA-binding protein [Azospirillum himalayense]|uniref:DNA-binding protein n=1 Tax=Azospirillum himalayense TaxID=654847 RepID=A0ABW0G7N1_9PROT